MVAFAKPKSENVAMNMTLIMIGLFVTYKLLFSEILTNYYQIHNYASVIIFFVSLVLL